MKRILLLFALSVCAWPVCAQIMPDSTIQIVAYWDRGDKYDYDFTEKRYMIQDGDTTVLTTLTERLTFEVVDSTETSYTLRLTFDNMQSSDPDKQRRHEQIKTLVPDTPTMIRTNEMGSYEQIVNLDEHLADGEKLVEFMSLEIYNKFTEEQKQEVTLDQIRKATKDMTCTPAAVETATLMYLSRFFSYFGARLNPTEEYSFQEELRTMTGEKSYAATRFWIDEEWTDDYSALLRSYTQFDATQAAATAIKGILESMEIKTPEDAFREFEDIVQFGVEIFTLLEVHLDSGWPIDVIQDRDITISDKTDHEKLFRISTRLTLSDRAE